MNLSPNIAEATNPAGCDIGVIIFGNNRRRNTVLRNLVESSLHPSQITLATTLSKLAQLAEKVSPTFVLIHFTSLEPANPDFFLRIRRNNPFVWLVVIAAKNELSDAFDLLGASVDDVLADGTTLERSLKESYSRANTRSLATERQKGYQNIAAIPLLAVADQMLEGLVLVDGEGVLLFANQAWRERFPSPTSGLVYIADLIHPNDLPRIDAELQLAILENAAGKAVFRVLTHNNEWAILRATITGMEIEGVRTACICCHNVTIYNAAQIQLGDAKRDLRLLNTFLEDFIYRYDPWQGRFHFLSDSLYPLTGYTIEEWKANPDAAFRLLIHPEDRDARSSALETLIRRGPGAPNQAFQYRIVRKDGLTLWVEERINVEWSRDGVHHWINGVLSDVTFRHSFDDRLRKTQEIHNLLFDELIEEGFIELEAIEPAAATPDFRIATCNQAFAKLAGLPIEGIWGTRLTELFPGLAETPLTISDGRSLPQVLSETAHDRKKIKINDFYWPHLRSYFHLTLLPLDNGRIALSLIDVTLQKQAEVRLEAVLRGLPDTTLYQTGGGVEYISPGIERMLGYPPEAFENDRNFFTTLIHPEDQAMLARRQQEWLKGGSQGVLDLEFRVQRKDGSYIWVLDRMSKAFTAPDGRQSSQGAMMDITARKRTEEQIIQKSAELEMLFRAMPDLYFRLDKDGRFLDWKAGAPDDLFVKPENFLGKKIQEVLPPKVMRAFDAARAKIANGLDLAQFEYSLPMPGGTRSYEARLFKVEKDHIAVLIRNITDSRKPQPARRSRTRAARKSK